jgi:hypothetical protein
MLKKFTLVKLRHLAVYMPEFQECTFITLVQPTLVQPTLVTLE